MRGRHGWRCVAVCLALGGVAHAGPETALREFSSSQIKKGVRVLGLGGDGATWGNYSLNWRDASSALLDYGVTRFVDRDNTIHFIAVGYTTPSFWRGTAVYVIAMAEWATGLHLHLASPAYPRGADFTADGQDQAVFLKIARPLGHHVSLGFLVGWERSGLAAVADDGGALRWNTSGLPQIGGGVTWEPLSWLLVGGRFLLNNDIETRSDARSSASGWWHSWEWRLGVSVRVWRGGLFDVGYVGLWRGAVVDGSNVVEHALTAGYEQEVWPRHLWLRAGWNETSPTAGLTARYRRFKLDAAYVYKLGVDRTAGLFGEVSHSVLCSLTFDYARW